MAPADSCAPPEPPDLSALWAHCPGAAFRLDADFRWTWLGESVGALTGRRARAWLADPAVWDSAVHPLDRSRHAAHRQSLEHHPRGASLWFRLLHARTGAVIWLHEFCVPEFEPGGKLRGFAGIWLDDARAARLEQRLAATAWPETLGAMTAGLVHDFNNVLTGVISLSEHFLTQIPPEHPFREGLTLLHDNGREASRWIQRFGQLHRTGPGTATWHDVNELVSDAAQILRHTLSRRYELTVHPSPEPEPVMVEAGGLQRALLMLVFRAAARMTQPGPMRLQVAHEPAKDGTAATWVRVGVETPSDLM
jgi:signal transduction histidine kinase